MPAVFGRTRSASGDVPVSRAPEARTLRNQAFDWNAHFAEFAYPEKVTRDEIGLHTHVVNNAMAMKTSGVYWQVSGDDDDRRAADTLLKTLE